MMTLFLLDRFDSQIPNTRSASEHVDRILTESYRNRQNLAGHNLTGS